MATILNPKNDDVELIGSRIARIDPDNFRNQGSASTDVKEEVADDEPTNEDEDPTNEHDHK